MDMKQNMGKDQGEERGKKLKLEGARSQRLKKGWREEYNVKNDEVKQCAREDKRNWLEKRAAVAQKTAGNGWTKKLYCITT